MEFYTYLKNGRFVDKSRTSVWGLLYTILRYALAAVLAISGMAKLADASGLLQTLQQVPFLSEGLTIWIATLLPVLEMALAAALFLQWKPPLTLAVIGLLCAGFLGFAIYGLSVGLSGDCSCFGSLAASSFGWGMVIRNLALFGAAIFLWVRNRYA